MAVADPSSNIAWLGVGSEETVVRLRHDDVCCKCDDTNRGMGEHLQMAPCGHKLCRFCRGALFHRNEHGAAKCPVCPVQFEVRQLVAKKDDTPNIEDIEYTRVLKARERVFEVYCRTRDSFPSLAAYNDYQEEAETMVNALVFGTPQEQADADANLAQMQKRLGASAIAKARAARVVEATNLKKQLDDVQRQTDEAARLQTQQKEAVQAAVVRTQHALVTASLDGRAVSALTTVIKQEQAKVLSQLPPTHTLPTKRPPSLVTKPMPQLVHPLPKCATCDRARRLACDHIPEPPTRKRRLLFTLDHTIAPQDAAEYRAAGYDPACILARGHAELRGLGLLTGPLRTSA